VTVHTKGQDKTGPARHTGDMSHDHSHSHGHGHSHEAPSEFGRAFVIGIALNVGLVAAQIGFGIAAHSVALLADAVHNFGDVLGLVFAWGAVLLGRLSPTRQRTYGWGRSTIMAALVNAIILLVGTGAIAVEAVQRLFHPEPVAGGIVMVVAAAGILLNGGTALMFMRGRHGDLNVRGAFLHMAADAGVSFGVVVAAGLIQLTGALWLDPVASLLIGAVIVAGTWGLLRDATSLAMDAVPPGVDAAAIERSLAALPGVLEVHDLHIWALSTSRTALTAHLVTAGPGDTLAPTACAMMHDQFEITHCTFQVETADMAAHCALRPEHVV
jgi:cobalt-zinc-cadmium efflux system protein